MKCKLPYYRRHLTLLRGVHFQLHYLGNNSAFRIYAHYHMPTAFVISVEEHVAMQWIVGLSHRIELVYPHYSLAASPNSPMHCNNAMMLTSMKIYHNF